MVQLLILRIRWIDEVPSLELAVDFTSADSYLALQPTRALCQDLKVRLKLVPFRVELTKISEMKEGSPVSLRHQYVRNTYRELNAARYAKVQNLPDLRSDPYENSTSALKGLVIANHKSFSVGFQYAADVFRQYWHEGLNLEDEDVLLSCLQKHGISANVQTLDNIDLDTIREEYQERGVMSVPMYLLQGQLFHGREHLPWISELMQSSIE